MAQAPYAAPETATEKLIASYWEELLDLETVSRHDEFVECGGNSLIATMLAHRLQKALSYRPTLTEIFRSTVESLARRCDEAVRAVPKAAEGA